MVFSAPDKPPICIVCQQQACASDWQSTTEYLLHYILFVGLQMGGIHQRHRKILLLDHGATLKRQCPHFPSKRLSRWQILHHTNKLHWLVISRLLQCLRIARWQGQKQQNQQATPHLNQDLPVHRKYQQPNHRWGCQPERRAAKCRAYTVDCTKATLSMRYSHPLQQP